MIHIAFGVLALNIVILFTTAIESCLIFLSDSSTSIVIVKHHQPKFRFHGLNENKGASVVTACLFKVWIVAVSFIVLHVS